MDQSKNYLRDHLLFWSAPFIEDQIKGPPQELLEGPSLILVCSLYRGPDWGTTPRITWRTIFYFGLGLFIEDQTEGPPQELLEGPSLILVGASL